jgi:hypothetical protein
MQRFRWTWPCSVPMAEALQGTAHGEIVPFMVVGRGIRATYRQAPRQYVCEYLSDAME